jgi:hypothetical protein
VMRMTDTSKVAFLFGSGISKPAGYPDTTELTKRVLSVRDVVRHTNGAYYLSGDASPGLLADYLPRVKDFLALLEREIGSYYATYGVDRVVNYEDLAFLASQIADSESFEYDNPAIGSLIAKIADEIATFLASTEDRPTHRHWSLYDIAEECLNYIKDITWHSLEGRPKTLDHLGIVADACRVLKYLDIFTLNHDTMLEHLFATESIEYDDGFGPVENGVRYWNPLCSCGRRNRVRLHKLHGSVDWFRLRPHGSSWERERVGIPQDGDFWHTRGSSGQLQMPIQGRPVFLTGTFNKMLDYTSFPYFDLQCEFLKRLRKTQRLVACGYSFNDKAINRFIVEWVYDCDKRKLIVCHRDPDGLRDSSRGVVKNKWEVWRNEKILNVVPKYIEELAWSDVEPHL